MLYCSLTFFSPFDDRGGGGSGKKWHQDGKRMKKQNSIQDYISCAEFLIEKGIVQENKLAGWGYSAGGLLVASAINIRPDLFHAAVLKVFTCLLLCYIYFGNGLTLFPSSPINVLGEIVWICIELHIATSNANLTICVVIHAFSCLLTHDTHIKLLVLLYFVLNDQAFELDLLRTKMMF